MHEYAELTPKTDTLRVLVATSETQGRRKNDFCHAEEGELVTFPLTICDGERADGRCGCKRSMSGVKSLKATTTMKVVEMETTLDMFTKTLSEMRQKAMGEITWAHLQEYGVMAEMIQEIVADAMEIVRIANNYPVGTVLEYRGSYFAAR